MIQTRTPDLVKSPLEVNPTTDELKHAIYCNSREATDNKLGPTLCLSDSDIVWKYIIFNGRELVSLRQEIKVSLNTRVWTSDLGWKM